jgi:cytochrome c biogenesis protein ResB
MGKNDFLAKQRVMQQAFFDAGIQSGRQQIMDMMSLVLHDKAIMGKDVFGKDRLVKVVQGIGEYIDKYQTAWEKSDEADYYQKKLDEALANIYGEYLADSFYDRYRYAPEYDYTKGKWKR